MLFQIGAIKGLLGKNYKEISILLIVILIVVILYIFYKSVSLTKTQSETFADINDITNDLALSQKALTAGEYLLYILYYLDSERLKADTTGYDNVIGLLSDLQATPEETDISLMISIINSAILDSKDKAVKTKLTALATTVSNYKNNSNIIKAAPACSPRKRILSPPRAPAPPPPVCSSENSSIGNVITDSYSGVEVFIYSYENDPTFITKSNQTATYFGREVHDTMPQMYANDPSLFADYMGNYPLAIMTRAMVNYDGAVRGGYIDVVSPDGFAITMEGSMMMQNWPPLNPSSLHSSACYKIGAGYNIYTQMCFYLSKVPQVDLSITLRDSNGASGPLKPSTLQTRVKKGLPVARWDFYTGNNQERNGILSSQINAASGQMSTGMFANKKGLQFTGKNGWVRTLNSISGNAFRSFTCMFYYTGLSNNAECGGNISNRLFSISNGTDLSSSYNVNNDTNVAIEGGIMDDGVAFIRLKSPSQQNSLIVKSSQLIPLNSWTHIAGVFSNDFTTVDIYVNGVLSNSNSNPAIDTNFYISNIFAYGSLGHAPGSFTATESPNPFLGGMAWQHWFDYPLCPNDVKTDYDMLFCDTSVYPEPAINESGWPRNCSEPLKLNKLDRTCPSTVPGGSPGASAAAPPGDVPLCPTDAEGQDPSCPKICVNSGQFKLTNAPQNSPWQSIATSSNGLIAIACGFGENVYIYNKYTTKEVWTPVNWTVEGVDLTVANWSCVACNGTGGIMVATTADGDIYLSTNSGVGNSWRRMTVNPVGGIGGWSGVSCSMASNSPVIIAVGANGVFRTTDNGNSWSHVGTALFSSYDRVINISSSADGQVHVALAEKVTTSGTSSSVSHGVFYSNDSGNTWAQSTGIPVTASIQSGVVSSDGNLAFIAVSNDGIYGSTDRGNSWKKSNIVLPGSTQTSTISIPNGNWQWITGTSDLKTMMICAQKDTGKIGNIYVSSNYGRTWNLTNAINVGWQAMACSRDGDFFYAVDGDQGAVWVSTCCDPTQFWTLSKTVANARFSSVAMADNGTCIASVEGGNLYLSTNKGLTWTTISDPVLPTENKLWKNVSCNRDGSIMVALVWGGYVYYSLSGGTNWKKATLNPNRWSFSTCSTNGKVIVTNFRGEIQIGTSNGTVINWSVANVEPQPWYSVDISDDGTKIVAVAANGFGISTSKDSGNTWRLTCAPTSMWEGVVSDSTGTKIFAVQYGGGIWYSNNGGATWHKTTAPNHRWLYICGSSTLCVLTAVADNCGIYMSFDFGQTWLNSNVNISNWTSVACQSNGIYFTAVDGSGKIYITGSTNTCSNPSYALTPATQ